MRNVFFAKRVGISDLREAVRLDAPMHIKIDDGSILRVFISWASEEKAKFWTFRGMTCGRPLSGCYREREENHLMSDFAMIRFCEENE